MKAQNSNKPETVAKDSRLSYSSMKELMSCEQRYAHRKIYGTAVDSDYEESDALGTGKAFHQVLENTLHKSWSEDLLLQAMVENKVDASDADLLRVMLTKYVEFRKASGYKIVKCELQIANSTYNGFIDGIAVKGDKWYIQDLKTAARFDDKLIPRLPMDPQLNLYAHFAPDIDIAVPEVAGLEFGGCLYTQIIKSKAGTMSGLEKGVKVYETIIPASVMKPKLFWDMLQDTHTRSLELRSGEAPKKNYSSCFNFFSPCPYFSQCHPGEFTKTADKVIVTTLETIKSEDLL